MKLAVVTPTPEVQASIPVALLAGTFPERWDKAARLGYDGVELLAVRPRELNANEIRAEVQARGLQVAAIGSGAIGLTDKLTLLAADTAAMRRAAARLNELIDFAAALGAPLVTIGGFRGRLAWAGGTSARARLIEILRAAAEHAAGQGARLVVEPLNRYESDIINDAAQGLALLAEVGHSQLGLLLDVFHMNIEEATFGAAFRQVMSAGKLWHVHMGDSNRLAPGWGHTEFGSIVAELREIGYDGYLSAELRPLPDPDAAAEATIRHMRQFISKGHSL